MYIKSLRIRDLRCLEAVDIELSPLINIFIGDNGTGKTSLLESVYLLSRGRSFRSAPQSRLIRKESESLSIFANVADDQEKSFSIGLQRNSDELRIKLSTDPDARLIHLVKTLPVQIIDPALHALFEEGPTARRRFLDWGVFHVEHSFFPAWHRYKRAIQQRNSVLRSGGSDAELKAWDHDILTSAAHINATRSRYVAELNKLLPGNLIRFENTDQIEIEYQTGWPKGRDFSDVLSEGLSRDRQLGYTMHGPHRADLRIRWHGVKAEQRASRGEQKVLICSLMLTQAELLTRQTDKRPVLLIDDLAAELGQNYRTQLLEVINSLQLQTFLTCLDKSLLPPPVGEHKMFHVEQGKVIRVV